MNIATIYFLLEIETDGVQEKGTKKEKKTSTHHMKLNHQIHQFKKKISHHRIIHIITSSYHHIIASAQSSSHRNRSIVNSYQNGSHF